MLELDPDADVDADADVEFDVDVDDEGIVDGLLAATTATLILATGTVSPCNAGVDSFMGLLQDANLLEPFEATFVDSNGSTFSLPSAFEFTQANRLFPRF